MRVRPLVWLPLLAFVALAAIVAIAIWKPADRAVRSALVGRPLPAFATPAMLPGRPGVAAGDFRSGRPRLLNVFASWCLPCAAEAPQLMRLKAMGVPIDAIAVHDTPDSVRAFLLQHGDPYQRIGDDGASAVQLAIGSAGVPETFLISGDGTILHQHIGDIRAEDVPELARLAGRSR